MKIFLCSVKKFNFILKIIKKVFLNTISEWGKNLFIPMKLEQHCQKYLGGYHLWIYMDKEKCFAILVI